MVKKSLSNICLKFCLHVCMHSYAGMFVREYYVCMCVQVRNTRHVVVSKSARGREGLCTCLEMEMHFPQSESPHICPGVSASQEAQAPLMRDALMHTTGEG